MVSIAHSLLKTAGKAKRKLSSTLPHPLRNSSGTDSSTQGEKDDNHVHSNNQTHLAAAAPGAQQRQHQQQSPRNSQHLSMAAHSIEDENMAIPIVATSRRENVAQHPIYVADQLTFDRSESARESVHHARLPLQDRAQQINEQKRETGRDVPDEQLKPTPQASLALQQAGLTHRSTSPSEQRWAISESDARAPVHTSPGSTSPHSPSSPTRSRSRRGSGSGSMSRHQMRRGSIRSPTLGQVPSAAEPGTGNLVLHPDLPDLLLAHGSSSATAWTEPQYHIWRERPGETGIDNACVGYLVNGPDEHHQYAMAWGNPLCPPDRYAAIAPAWIKHVTDEGRRPMWCCIDEHFMHVLTEYADKYSSSGEQDESAQQNQGQNQDSFHNGASGGSEFHFHWSALTCIQEEYVDARSFDRQVLDKRVRTKLNKAERKGLEMIEVSGRFPDAGEQPELPKVLTRKTVEEGVMKWKQRKASRSAQIHVTDVEPWRDLEHRRYFYAVATKPPVGQATSSSPPASASPSSSPTLGPSARSISGEGGEEDKQVLAGMLVLQPVANRAFVVKWLLEMDDQIKGTSESLLVHALEKLRDQPTDAAAAEVTRVTFGISAGELKAATPGLANNWKMHTLSAAYNGISKTFRLGSKSSFRHKFGGDQEPMYIAFPPRSMGHKAIDAIVSALKEDTEGLAAEGEEEEQQQAHSDASE